MSVLSSIHSEVINNYTSYLLRREESIIGENRIVQYIFKLILMHGECDGGLLQQSNEQLILKSCSSKSDSSPIT